MEDLKVYINEKEDPKQIDDKIISLYESIGMKINSKKSGITIHNNMEVNKELIEKYTPIVIIIASNYYDYITLFHIFIIFK